MCGCQGGMPPSGMPPSYSSMNGNASLGLVPYSGAGGSPYVGVEDTPYSNAEGDDEGEKVQNAAQVASDTADKAIGILGTFKGLADTLTGKSGGSVEVNADPELKNDKKLYLYAVGGLLLLVAVIFITKKAKKQ